MVNWYWIVIGIFIALAFGPLLVAFVSDRLVQVGRWKRKVDQAVALEEYWRFRLDSVDTELREHHLRIQKCERCCACRCAK